MYGVLDLLIWHMKEAGYVPDLDCLIHDQEDATWTKSEVEGWFEYHIDKGGMILQQFLVIPQL